MRALLLVLCLATQSAAAAGELCVAIDGDSLVCGTEHVRVAHIYAPEKGAPGYEEARQRLQARLDAGVVTLERKSHRGGRSISKVYVDGVQIRQKDIGPRAGRGSDHGRNEAVPSHHRGPWRALQRAERGEAVAR